MTSKFAPAVIVELAWRDTAQVDAVLLGEARAWLRADESARVDRLVRDADRRNALVGRWLVRRLLARATATAPADWALAPGPHGRPEPAHPSIAVPPSINFSHTRTVVVAALCRDAAVGIDVEHPARVAPVERLARFFSPAEVAWLTALDVAGRQLGFWRLWTLKEAWLKARGSGITGALDSTTIGFADPAPPRLLAARDDEPAAWRFAEVDLAPGFLTAVAVRCGSRELAVERGVA
ncbi:MAG: 4'-phosphopantetheinyl transferase superfamily protein [Planctomycetes bacterium]|nr:4'-phosphopantetheinyl transferase superfamily protein [Planctomycetota bacterium]